MQSGEKSGRASKKLVDTFFFLRENALIAPSRSLCINELGRQASGNHLDGGRERHQHRYRTERLQQQLLGKESEKEEEDRRHVRSEKEGGFHDPHLSRLPKRTSISCFMHRVNKSNWAAESPIITVDTGDIESEYIIWKRNQYYQNQYYLALFVNSFPWLSEKE